MFPPRGRGLLSSSLLKKGHATGAGGCPVTGSAPRPWPQSGPPTSQPREAHPEGNPGDEGAAPDKAPPDSTCARGSRQAWPGLPGSEGRPRGQWWPRLSLLSGRGMASQPGRALLLPPQRTPGCFDSAGPHPQISWRFCGMSQNTQKLPPRREVWSRLPAPSSRAAATAAAAAPAHLPARCRPRRGGGAGNGSSALCGHSLFSRSGD